jgi:hypothetical protein
MTRFTNIIVCLLLLDLYLGYIFKGMNVCASRLVADLSPRRSVNAPGSVHLGFLVGIVVLGRVLLRVLQIPLSISFHHDSPCSYIIWRMNNRPVSGRSSET